MILTRLRSLTTSLLAVSACLGLVTACNGDDTGASESATTTTDPTTTTAPPETESESASTTDDPTTTTDDPTTTTTGDPPPFCGDGNVDRGEECDDGNNFDGDGCSADCEIEGGQTMCIPQDQDCPEGQKCTASNAMTGDFWNINICIDLMGDQALGDPCEVLTPGELGSGIDDCALGLICLNFGPDGTGGSCLALCGPDNSCPAGNACVVANEGALPICLPSCDPLIQDCPGTQGCYGSTADGVFLCFEPDPQSGGMDNDECAFDNACVPGFQCVASPLVAGCDPGFEGCCNPFCDVTGDGQECDEGEECAPFFEEPTPPWEDAGICVIPT